MKITIFAILFLFVLGCSSAQNQSFGEEQIAEAKTIVNLFKTKNIKELEALVNECKHIYSKTDLEEKLSTFEELVSIYKTINDSTYQINSLNVSDIDREYVFSYSIIFYFGNQEYDKLVISYEYSQLQRWCVSSIAVVQIPTELFFPEPPIDETPNKSKE